MLVQYASDLHLEFLQNKDFLKANPLQPKGDVLLLAGDIVPFAVMDKHKDFFDYVSDNFHTTYWIPGNHEYYYFDVSEKSGDLHETIRNNIHLVNNYATTIQDVQFVFSTLWSKISPANQFRMESSLSDFQVIRFNKHRFTTEHFNKLHDDSLDFISTQIHQKSTSKRVVVTHHVPSFLYYPEKYKNDALNEGFASELHGIIESSEADYWIFGHHHQNIPDFMIGQTTLVTNQLGYVKYNEHTLFKLDKTFNIVSDEINNIIFAQ